MTALLDRPLSTVQRRTNAVSHVLHSADLRPSSPRSKGRINNNGAPARPISASHLISQPIENNFLPSLPQLFLVFSPVPTPGEGGDVAVDQMHLFYREPSARRTVESSSENFAVSGPKFAHSRFPRRRKSGLLDDILVCVFSPSRPTTFLSPRLSEPLGSSLIFANIFSTLPSLRHFSLPLLVPPSPFFSFAQQTFPQTLLRCHSCLLYSPTSIRIPVACYIMAYQLFCQFPVRAPDEWDFFLVLLPLLCAVRAVEIISQTLAVSFTRAI